MGAKHRERNDGDTKYGAYHTEDVISHAPTSTLLVQKAWEEVLWKVSRDSLSTYMHAHLPSLSRDRPQAARE